MNRPKIQDGTLQTDMNYTWETYLDDIFRLLKPDEKIAFAEAVGVTPKTIGRWRSGEDLPQPKNLERLLFTALSMQQRQAFLPFLKKDLRMWQTLPPAVRERIEREQEGLFALPSSSYLDAFCLKLLRLQRDTPDRFWQISGVLLREALTTLETHPEQVGIKIVVALCTPPHQGKIQSLHAQLEMGTTPWRGDLHLQDYYLGGESLAGYVTMHGHGEMIPDIITYASSLPSAPLLPYERSIAAFPIRRTQDTAGAFIVSCTQPDYFIPERMTLIEIFADLIRLALYDEQFFPLALFQLAMMPSQERQQALLAAFRQRVEQAYRRTKEASPSSILELSTIEQETRRQLEEELLQQVHAEDSSLPA